MKSTANSKEMNKFAVATGADQLNTLIPKLKDKRIALMVNQSAVVGKVHLVDTLLSLGVKISKILAPEHGFRGAFGYNEEYNKDNALESGVPVINMYNPKNASVELLDDVDVVMVDVQDVGARFYTYTRNLHYQMEACALAGKHLILLDRPNPNGSYVDGPVLRTELYSNIGMHPVPIVHGMTLGEYAQMINGEGWLKDGRKCSLEVIKVKNWKHSDSYHIAIRPSPNLPNDNAIGWYPSTALFEGVNVSVGRGTSNPFEFIGGPQLTGYSFQFTPVNTPGFAVSPPYQDKLCYGIDLRAVPAPAQISLTHLIRMYQAFPDKSTFFKESLFDRLAGTTALREQIKNGLTEEQIKATWQEDLAAFKKVRSKYLLYP